MTYSRANADNSGDFQMITTKYFRSLMAVTLIGAFGAPGALAACQAPEAPEAIPDGRTADKAEMLAAKRNVEAYVQQVAAYVKCEQNDLKRDVAKARQTKIVDRFNSELREFKSVASSPVRTASLR
jgi:hypothetical protein